MSRLQLAFTQRPAFMPYFPLGYPTPEISLAVMAALARGGAHLIEVGIPFSDPLADGPVIQQATQQALANGMTVERALAAVAELRARGVTIPLVLMSYYNPLLAYGLQRLAAAATQVGADGFIVPDLPPEEAGDFTAALAPTSLPLIRMLAPTSTADRIAAITRGAEGFLYLVSLTGTTGARENMPPELPEFVARVRAALQAAQRPDLPLCVGFGIGTPEQARAVGQLADGVIVGSACVRRVGEASDPVEAAERFAREFAAIARPVGG